MKTIFCLLFALTSFSIQSQGVIDSGLVAFFPFCGNAVDQSSNNNDGILYGGVTFVADRLGNPNSACHFDGIDDFIQVPNSNTLNDLTDNLTMSCWFYTKSYDFTNNFWVSLFSKSDSPTAPSRQYAMIYDIIGRVWFDTLTVVENQIIPTYEWHHLTMTYESFTVKCYLDGNLIGEEFLANGIEPNDLPLDIGRDVCIVTEFHHGMIDDLRIYNRVLSNEEIAVISSTNFDCSAISTNEPQSLSKITLYPNPTEGTLMVKSDNISSSFTIKIYNSLGKLYYFNEIDANNQKINLENLDSGIYIFEVIADGNKVAKKIIKI